MTEHNYIFRFGALAKGELGLTVGAGAYFTEAASYCLHVRRHPNPVHLSLSGDVSGSGTLEWAEVCDAHHRTHADLQDAVEFGACAIGIVIAVQLAEVSGVERSVKGTGIDFWLVKDSDDRGVFQHSARLEVSGILTGNKNTIEARMSQKLAQTAQTDNTGLPAYVVVVEFGTPEARFVKKSSKVGKQ